MSAARLDMGHGFIRFITRNQIDRDNYDKKEKARVAQSKQPGRPVHVTPKANPLGNKGKKPDIQTYVPPTKHNKHLNTCTSEAPVIKDESMSDVMFRLEYEDQDGNTHDLYVHTNDDPSSLSKRFGRDLGFTPSMYRAFTDFLKEQIRKHMKS